MRSWGTRMMQYYQPSHHLSHKQPWICYAYRSATCRFSKSSGPVRYVPKVLKQSPLPRQDEQANSRINNPVNHFGAQMHGRTLSPEAQQGNPDPSLLGGGYSSIQHRADAQARRGSHLNQENAMYTASIHESMETCYSEELEVHTSSAHVPASITHSLERGNLLDSSYHANRNKKSESISKGEITIQPAYVKLQNPASCKAKSAAQLSRSSSYLPTPIVNVMQTGKPDTRYLEDMVLTREKDLLSVKAERNAFLEDANEIPPLTLQNKNLKTKEADKQGMKPLPWQDAESFLLKVQSAKQRSLSLSGMPHTAATEERVVEVSEDVAEDFGDEDEFMLLEQETLEQNENVGGASRWLDVHSIAEQEHAKNLAVRYLSMRPYTAEQLRKKLVDRSIAPDLADYALVTVQRCGLQSDVAYAETYSYTRFNNRGWGPQKIKLALKQRGVSNEIVKAAIGKVFYQEEGDSEQDGASEDDDSTPNVGNMSKASMNHLLAQATKQWNRGKTATIDTRTRRMVCWLQYRGFPYSVVKHVLNHLRKQVSMEEEL